MNYGSGRCLGWFVLLSFLLGGNLILNGCDSGGSSSPDPNLVDGVALSGSDQSDVAAVATHEDGEWLTAFSRDASGQVTEVAYGTSDGDRVTVKLDEQGRPNLGAAGPYIVAFGNYDGSRADVALLNTDSGEITTYENVDLGIDPSTNSLSKRSDDLSPAEALEAASVGVTAFSCTLAFIDISGFSAGACATSVLLQAGTRALQETEWGETAEWVGFGVDAFECGSDYGVSCVAAGIDLGLQVVEEDENQIGENEEDIAQASGVARFGGTWAYRDINQGWFVMNEDLSYDAIYNSSEDCYVIVRLDFLEVDGSNFRYERRSDGNEIRAEFSLTSEDVLTATRLNDGAEFKWDRDSSQNTQVFFDNECASSSASPAARTLSQ